MSIRPYYLLASLPLYLFPVYAIPPVDNLAVAPAPRPIPPDTGNDIISGIVKTVDRQSLTIHIPESISISIKQYPDGRVTGHKFITCATTRTFATCEALAKGEFTADIFFVFSYKLSDIKLGDHVDLQYRRVAGIETCDGISITRRPNGTVPMPHGGDLVLRQRRSLSINNPLPPSEETAKLIRELTNKKADLWEQAGFSDDAKRLRESLNRVVASPNQEQLRSLPKSP